MEHVRLLDLIEKRKKSSIRIFVVINITSIRIGA